MNVNFIDKFGGNSLFDAFVNGHFHLCEFLHSRDARFPENKQKELTFYLNCLGDENHFSAIQCLIKCGLNPNLSDFNGENALHVAVMNNHSHLVHYFIEETKISFDNDSLVTDYFPLYLTIIW